MPRLACRYCESIEVGRMTLLLGRACAAAVYGLAARVMLTRYESRQSSR